MDWRVSIAGVAVDGPFSSFAGYDRHIMALDGNGMALEGGPDGSIFVAPAFAPVEFSGDWKISARLLGGPLRDFNLILRRELGIGRLTSIVMAAPDQWPADGSTRLLYCISGKLTCNGQTLEKQDAALLTPAEDAVLHPLEDKPRIALCQVWQGNAQ